ncbi:MAG: ubiquinone biosynthesis protein [Actinomycetota bacterium]|jgi:predicted unusual protein kinase regulating ubiquinone biosynthesis (AarF/ABC1/UbiB family)|nr:ubiquinone biosynthesis protein [Actinomycetota bacterium]
MALSLSPKHLARYRDIAKLLIRYGRSDLVRDLDIDGLEPEDKDTPLCEDAAQLADDLEKLGPTFIKLGQLMSTRVDLLPAPYTEALSRLQDDVAPFPYDEVERIVVEELGVDLRHAFASFDAEPLAAASLAQVHRATLHSGREVVVKVQRPGIRAQIADDMAALGELAGFADAHTEIGRRFGFAELLEQFRRALVAELDYTREASNLTTLARIVQPWPRLVVPRPVADYSTGRVLTMDYLPGRKVTDLGPLARTDLDGGPLVDDLFRAYLQQILAEGFFHADPHPGNVLLTADDRLALIDLGMVARLSASSRDCIVKLLLAVSDGNGEGAADALASLGTQRDDFDRDRFRGDVGDLVQRSVELGSQLQAGAVVLEMTRIAGRRGLRPAPELALVGKALLNLDQVAQTLDPTFAPADAVRRHTASILQSRMTTSTGGLLGAAMEARDFTVQLPGRINKVMDAVADGKFELKVDAIDEPQLLAVLQRLANRLATGLVLASLVIGAALMMQIPTKSRIFGYPSIAMVCFALAAGGGAALLVSVLMADRRIARTARDQRRAR